MDGYVRGHPSAVQVTMGMRTVCCVSRSVLVLHTVLTAGFETADQEALNSFTACDENLGVGSMPFAPSNVA